MTTRDDAKFRATIADIRADIAREHGHATALRESYARLAQRVELLEKEHFDVLAVADRKIADLEEQVRVLQSRLSKESA